MMKIFFRPRRLPPQLTLPQITKLSNQFSLSSAEIERWYERFIRCYPYGYISFQEFGMYLKQANIYEVNQQHALPKSLMRQLFSTLDLNDDQELDFEEFFQFTLFINEGTDTDKLKLVLNLCERQQTYYKQQEIVNILANLFGLLNIPRWQNDLSERVGTILRYVNMNNNAKKISWNKFCLFVLNHSPSFDLLLAHNMDSEDFEENLVTSL